MPRNLMPLILTFTVLVMAGVALAQPAGNPDMQEKLAAVKQSAAANAAALRKYQWMETMQVAMKGEVKSTKRNQCRYAADGTVVKTPIDTGAPAQQPDSGGGRRGGRLKEKIVENKKDELEDYMKTVKALIDRYVPPTPAAMETAAKAGKISVTTSATPGVMDLVFKDYAQAGDSMSIAFVAQEKKMAGLNVNSFIDDPKDTVTLMVSFAALPDGTSYPAQIVLNAKAKNIQVTINNTNYQQVAP